MIYLNKFCCVCLDKGQELEKILMIQDNLSYYDKLSILIPEMDINKIKKIAFICNECKKCTDNMFKFRSTCLRNNERLQKYISQLSLDENDINNTTSFIIKQKMDISGDNPFENKSTIYLNENQNVLRSENILSTNCDREIDIEEHIKKEIFDDDVVDHSGSESISKNDDTHTYTDNGVVSLSETNKNFINFKDTSNNINIDVNKHIKCETFDDNFVGTYESEFENVSVNDHTNTVFETNINRTITGLTDPLENNSNENYDSFHPEEDFTNNKDNVHANINFKICVICNKYFTKLSDLRNHLSDKTYKCETCIKTFTLLYNFEKHIKSHTKQLEEKQYRCEVCNKSFMYSSCLEVHRLIHTGENPHKCEICYESFYDKTNLNKHIKIHIGEKLYKCEICNKSFIESNKLKKHNKIHTGDKPHKCEICNKSFILFHDLKTHHRIHTGEKPYKCDVCNKSFSQSSSLILHSRTHTGEKPYRCDICNKSFSQSASLNKHSRIHTGEKPYKCEVCNKAFSQSSSLFTHSKIHTNE